MKHPAASLLQQRYLWLYVLRVVVTDYLSEYLFNLRVLYCAHSRWSSTFRPVRVVDLQRVQVSWRCCVQWRNYTVSQKNVPRLTGYTLIRINQFL